LEARIYQRLFGVIDLRQSVQHSDRFGMHVSVLHRVLIASSGRLCRLFRLSVLGKCTSTLL